MQMGVEQFAEQMISGLTEPCWQTIVQFMDAGNNSLFIYEQLLAPAMRYIGSLWEHNLITAAEEHLASGICDIILSRYASMKKSEQSNGRKAMLLCIEGETHFLGLKMVSSLFQEHGWETRFYGPSLPLEYAVITGMNWKPDVIGMSVSIVYHMPRLKEYVESLDKLHHKPTLMIGGRLIDPYAIHRMVPDKVVLLPDLLQLNDWLLWYERTNKHQTSMG